jgi:hypothetical protein
MRLILWYLLLTCGVWDSKGELTYCWGRSASEGPQKHDLTVFLEYNVWTGIFGLVSEREKLKRYEGW